MSVTTNTTSRRVTRAVVLAAGNGDRFQHVSGQQKLLHPFMGRPLLLRTIEAAREAGVEQVTVVLGHKAENVRALVESGAPRDLAIRFVVNPEWQLENGVSVMTARQSLAHASEERSSHFALLMGDHLFDPAVLRQLLALDLGAAESVLAVDARTSDPRVIEEATKVRRDGARIVAIGKNLADFDALDTGMFVCAPNLFDALARARESGDTTLSGGIRQLAAAGHMRAFEIGDAEWRDIDTVEDLADAETAMGMPS